MALARPDLSFAAQVHTTHISDSHYQSTLDAVYVYVVPWSEFPIVPSYAYYPHTLLGAFQVCGVGYRKAEP